MNLHKNKVFLSFFLIYFVITMFQVIFLYFIPLFYLDVLKVDPKELALVQIFPYLPLFMSPLFGYFYDRYFKKEVQSKLLFYICCLILSGSILIFIFYKESLYLFGLFTFLSLFSIFLIRTVMSNLYLRISQEFPSVKQTIILILRITTIIAYLTTSILFQVIIVKISLLTLWHIFFFLCFSVMIIFIIISVALNSKIQLLSPTYNIKESSKSDSLNNKNPIMLIIYIAFFLGSSDLLFLYLFSSWILNKYGESSFRVYSFLLLIFPIGQLLGNIIAYKLDLKKGNNGKEYDKRKLMFIGIISYMLLMGSLTVSNFVLILIINFGLSFTASLAIFSYTSFITDISKNKKYKTCKFQFLQTYTSLAKIIFVPISYLLYSFVVMEFLILTSVVLFGISGMFILITYSLEKDLYK